MAGMAVKNNRFSKQRGLMAKALEVANESTLQYSGRYDNVDYDREPSSLSSGVNSSINNHTYNDVPSERLTSPWISNEEIFLANGIHSSGVFDFSRDSTNLPLHSNKFNFSKASKNTSPISPLSEAMKKRHLSRQSSSDGILKPIKEHEHDERTSLSSTQHLRSGFFRTIKKQYPNAEFDCLGFADQSTDSGIGASPCSTECEDISSNDTDNKEELPFMSSMTRRRLRDLRKIDPTKVDVTTGLQWIRLELHEMREQDKALFLQLIKLHSTIKEVRAEMKVIENDSDSSYDDISDAASLWWPRCNSSSVLPDFSSSDGAQLLMRRQDRPLYRRGASFNLPRSRPTRYVALTPLNPSPTSPLSFSSSFSSHQGSTAC